MNDPTHTPSDSLSQKDFERFERIVWKSSDDLAVSFARSCERLEERLDAAEMRLYARLTDLEEQISQWATAGLRPAEKQ